MLLRSLAKNAGRPMVYLIAQRCNGGVLEAIQGKLFGYAQDMTFLQSLVYSGGIDVAIDGLNEVSLRWTPKFRQPAKVDPAP